MGIGLTNGRRQFLRNALQAAGALAAVPAMQSLRLLDANGRAQAAPGRGGYGPLVAAPDLRDGVHRLSLPEGFEYRSFSPAGALMSDFNRVPLAHDGMGVFNTSDGRFRLVRNHEDRNGPGLGTTAIDHNAYDARGGGGTTTLIVNPFTRQLERDFVSLSGTIVNCAGGVTPWESWITCEETNAGPNSGWLKQHGYCFDVPAGANGTVPAVALPDMGRFSHEAMAVDPNTWIVYETEDNGGSFQGSSGTSGFYRFIANQPGNLVAGGRLQMLAIVDRPNYDARRDQQTGVSLPVTWVDIDNPNPAGTSSTAVFAQGWTKGGARFRRLEGCWWGNGAVYFADTSGGNAARGTIWEYRPDNHGGTLTLIFESSGAHELDFPDNLAVSPQGSLLLCEDGDGDQYLRGVTLGGEIFDFGKNIQNDYEWAGATFAEADPAWNDRKIRGNHKPLGNRWDRVTLFVNRQGATGGANPPPAGEEGLTFAIWGPWGDGAL
jgi:secreted PhoX family phosphatase